MTALLFVYGTLKQGFPNFPLNAGRRLQGLYRTRQPFPLYVVQLANEERAPWLMDDAGRGHQVLGQVFEVDYAALAAMDRFEEVGQPTGYVRAEVELEPAGAMDDPALVLPQAVRAQVYLKPVLDLPRCRMVEGPFEEYTLALAQGYRLSAT